MVDLIGPDLRMRLSSNHRKEDIEMKDRIKRLHSSWKIFPCIIIVIAVLFSPVFGAEDPAKFPSKEITMVVPWPAGGVGDTTSRMLADLAGPILGQPVVIVNKTGAAGVIGLTAVAKAKPDGYTIGNYTPSPIVYVPHLRSVPYNVKKDFTWINKYLDLIVIFCVQTNSDINTFEDLIEKARKNPGKLNYATAGPLGSQHIVCEYVFSLKKVKLNHVPVEGAKEAARQLLGGHIIAALSTETVHHLRTGKFRGLVAHSEKRLKEFTDIPTFSEIVGFDLHTPNYMGLCAPAGLHPVVLNKLYTAFKKAYENPSFQELVGKKLKLEPSMLDPDSTKKMVLRDFDEQREIIKKLGFIK
jgi:tripartite-type tricarboxylate transporter receptor subunit TctC